MKTSSRTQPEMLPGMDALRPVQQAPASPHEIARALAERLSTTHIVVEETQPLVPVTEPTELERRARILERRSTVVGLFGQAAAREVVEKDTFEDITAEMVAFVEPSNLYAGLAGYRVVVMEGKRGKQAVWYTGMNGKKWKVALSATEKAILPGSIEAYSNSAAIASRNGPNQQLMDNPDEGAPMRAVGHVLDGKLPAVETYLEKTLRPQEAQLAKLTNALKKNNRQVPLQKGLIEAQDSQFALDQVILGSIDALADQYGWDRQTRQNYYRAIQFRLYVDREGNKHLDYAHKLCIMLLSYQQAKINAFQERVTRGRAHRAAHQ